MSSLSFRCNATAGTTVENLRYFTQEDAGTTSSALDFAWNNQRVRFNTSNTTTATTDFDYNGTAQQLTNDVTQWRTTPNDIENTPFDLMQTTRWAFSEIGELRNALYKIFKKVPKELIKTEEDKKLVKAKEQSEKLLKSWLTKAEYDALINKGEVEIPSKEEDVIFIVKRDPNEMVDVKKHGRFSHKLCAVAEDLDYPVGDQLLSKIVLLKTDEDKFKKIAIKHGGSTYVYDEI